MKTSIISVAYFSNNPETMKAVLTSDEVRRKTLKACYEIPEYENMTLKEKNKIYDKIKATITA